MYKKNPISSGLITLLDPANNYSYGSGSVIRSNSSHGNMLVSTPASYLTIQNCTYTSSLVLNPFGGGNVNLLKEFRGGPAAGQSILSSTPNAYTPGTYTGIATTSAFGTGAIVTIVINALGSLASASLTTTGNKYMIGDVLTIVAGGAFGGTAPANNITLSITAVSATTKIISQNPATEFDSNVWGLAQFANKACVTVSAYIKQDTSGTLRDVYMTHENVQSNGLSYNFATGFITNSSPASIVAYGAIDAGGGWFRLWYTYNATTPPTSTTTFNPGNPRLRFYLGFSGAPYIGNGTGGLFVYGHQYEYGALTDYVLKTDDTRNKWFTARQTINPAGTGLLPGPTGQSGVLLDGATVIRFTDPDSQGQRRGLIQAGGRNGIASASSFSAFAWINLDSTAAPLTDAGTPGTYCNIIGKINGKTNNNCFQIKNDGKQLAFKARAIRNTLAIAPEEVILSDFLTDSICNTWAYVGISWEWGALPGNTTIRFYVNGSQLGSSKTLTTAYTYVGLDNTSTSGINIGWDVTSSPSSISWGQFKGDLGMMGIYNRALTFDEMKYNFDVTQYRYPDFGPQLPSLILHGAVTSYNGNPISGVSLVKTNGDYNTAFTQGTGFSGGDVLSSIQTSVNSFIVVGSFTSYNGTACNRIVKLFKNGTIDTSFVIGTGFDAQVQSIAQDSSGNYYIGGSFLSYNGTPCSRLIKLFSNGTVDPSFNGLAFAGVSSSAVGTSLVNKIIIDRFGQIYAAGSFWSYSGTVSKGIVRLNTNGTIDTVFNLSSSGFNSDVTNIAIDPVSYKLYCTGGFSSYKGSLYYRIIRLNEDGSIDTLFNTTDLSGGPDGRGFRSSPARTDNVALQSDGKLIVVGDFVNYNYVTKNNIIRLNTNGTIDNTFNSGTGFNARASALRINADDTIWVGGQFTTYKGTPANSIIKLLANGDNDTSFNSGVGFTKTAPIGTGVINVNYIQILS